MKTTIEILKAKFLSSAFWGLTSMFNRVIKAGKPIGTISTHHDGTKWKKVSEGEWRQISEGGEETGQTSYYDESELQEKVPTLVNRKNTDKNGNPRQLYEPTKKQVKRWQEYEEKKADIPTDEEFKEQWKRSHHGSEKGWGMGKQQYMISLLRQNPDYELGIGQGRVDAHRGLDYNEERSKKPYNLGYHLGYTEYASNRRGWDDDTTKRFDEKYGPRKDLERQQKKQESRQYLNVPFSDKDEAKRHGAKWDPDKKKWYHEGDHPNPEKFDQWKSQKSYLAKSLKNILNAAKKILNDDLAK